jgi:Zn-dependent protease with chaperone function
MLGFYALAIAIIIGLLAILYAVCLYANQVFFQIAIGCIVGAIIIAWSILPRWDRFEDPGPRLTPEAQPELFENLEAVARTTEQAMPREVFLVPDVNAWVANRGGVMGIGSHRVMGLGLPLLQVLSVSELGAVVAHEFGHYHGGDTKLGPWIYKTRVAIGRTIENLGEERWLHLPFRFYGNFFLRITQTISRAQELTADRLAATVVGAGSLIEGLKKLHALAPAYEAYWMQEARPVLSWGFRVPLMGGFERFKSASGVEAATERALEEALTAEADSFDSHPPLGQRIAAVEALPDAPSTLPDDARPAIALLGDVGACEKALIGFLAKPGAEFETVPWSEVTDRVLIPGWRSHVEALRDFLPGTTLTALPELIRERGHQLARLIAETEEFEVPAEYPPEIVPEILSGPLGSCILCALHDVGWSVATDVGEAVTVHRGETTLEPFSVVGRIAQGEDGARWWRDWVRAQNVGALPLVPETGESLTATPEYLRRCPECGHPYRLSDYRPDATEIGCSRCHARFPRPA